MAVPWVRGKKKAASSAGGRSVTSNPKYLGVKVLGEQYCTAGTQVVRQRGLKFAPGENMAVGRDHTLYALVSGFVEFQRVQKPRPRQFVHCWPETKEENMLRVQARKEKAQRSMNSIFNARGRRFTDPDTVWETLAKRAKQHED